MRLKAVFLALLLACSVPALLAQTANGSATQPPAADVDSRIADLEKQVQLLQSEVTALKTNATATAAPAVLANAAVASNTSAQPAPKPAPLAGIASVLNGATVTGEVDTYYGYNFNHPANDATALRLFDPRINQFALDMIELGLVKTPSPDSRLGYNVTFGFGDAMNVINSSDPSFLQYLKESYFSYLAPVGEGLQIDVGKFVTPAGAEVIESYADWNYSRSILFNYAIPFYHFGVRAKYAFNDKYALTGYVVNGWNDVIHDSSTGYGDGGKTGGLSFAWTPNKKWSFTQNWLGGPGATPLDGSHCAAFNGLCSDPSWRNLLDTVVLFNATSKLALQANYDYGRSESILGSRPVHWSGVAGYARYQVTPKNAIATRYEYYDDHDGVTTGSFIDGAFVPTPQHLQEGTATLERRVASHLVTRLEYRHDHSDIPYFLRGTSPAKDQNTLAGGLILVLEPSETQ